MLVMSALEPRKILLLAPRFEARGICAYTVRLARGLGRRDFDPCVVTPDASSLDPRIRAEIGVNEWGFCDVPFWGPLLSRLRADLAESDRPQLIHVQSPRMLALGNDLARRFERPYVLTMHHLGDGERIAIDRRWCRRVIAASETLARELAGRGGLPASLISVVPPGVEVDAEARACLPLDAGHVPVIGTAGPLESGKGLSWFLGAARLVLADFPEVEFMIAGAGREEANLRRLARELQIAPQVTFAPYLTDFRVSLEAMDIFCLPAVRRGLSAIMLEAMALGRPVVATSLGDIDDVLEHGVNGLLAPPENLQALADCLLQLLRNPVQARGLGKSGRESVRHNFSVDQMVDQTVEIYRAVLEPPQTAAA